MEKKQILIAPYKYSFKPASYDIFDMCNKDEIDLIKNKYPNDEYKRIFIIVDRNEESIKDFLDSEDSIMHCDLMLNVSDYLSIAEDESNYEYIIRSKAFSNAESVIESEKVVYIENLLDEMEVK